MDLEELVDQPARLAPGYVEGTKYAYQEGKAIRKVRYTHDAMIDEIIRNPAVSQNGLAAIFGFTPAWVSLVISSDAFQARLAARKAELVDPTIALSIKERFQGLVTKSLEVLQEKLAQPAASIPDNLLLRAAELGAKSLGFGAVPSVTINQNVLDLRQAIEEGQARREVLRGEFVRGEQDAAA